MNPYRWYEALPDLYQREIDTIKKGFAHEFELEGETIITDGFRKASSVPTPFLADGSIFIWGLLTFEGGRQRILIEFPPTFSAVPATITPVVSVEVQDNILNYKPIIFGKGQQFIDGHMCLFEDESWNGDSLGIGYILRRSQLWLKYASLPAGFPSELTIQEYVPPIPPLGAVILPIEFNVPNELSRGTLELIDIGMGRFVLSRMESLVTKGSRSKGTVVKWSGQPSPLNPPKAVKVPGHWLKLATVADMNDVFRDFGTSADAVLERLGIDMALSMQSVASNGRAMVGIINPKSPPEWHFLMMIGNPGNQSVQVHYLQVQNFMSEAFVRAKDLYDLTHLSNCNVTVVGVGAIGADAAVELARSGVGNFFLFDAGNIQIGNSIRHAADIRHLGQNKVEAVKQLILGRNPNAMVTAQPHDVMRAPKLLSSAVNVSDLTLVMTAKDTVDYHFNDKISGSSKKPFIFARVSKGALSGVVQVVIPGVTACLRCLDLYAGTDLPVIDTELEKIRIQTLGDGGCGEATFPGIGIDTREIALQVARVSLQTLLMEIPSSYPKLPGYQFRWHGPSGSVEKPAFTWEITKLGPHPECRICSNRASLQ